MNPIEILKDTKKYLQEIIDNPDTALIEKTKIEDEIKRIDSKIIEYLNKVKYKEKT